MFIELTDHLRCPADHAESFLVLLPDRMDGRSVRAGQLGCPVCGRTFEVAEGILDVGDAPPSPLPSALDAEAITALAGVNGPGGYLVLVGSPAGLWSDVAELNRGVGLVAVNPDAGVTDQGLLSVLRGGVLPLKSRSMRGVVLGRPFGGDRHWVGEGARVTLPGLRIVGEGPDPPAEIIDLMASTGGVWVGTAVRSKK
jgi:uncharacterized protein YbaR (Trm112 family)